MCSDANRASGGNNRKQAATGVMCMFSSWSKAQARVVLLFVELQLCGVVKAVPMAL